MTFELVQRELKYGKISLIGSSVKPIVPSHVQGFVVPFAVRYC